MEIEESSLWAHLLVCRWERWEQGRSGSYTAFAADQKGRRDPPHSIVTPSLQTRTVGGACQMGLEMADSLAILSTFPKYDFPKEYSLRVLQGEQMPSWVPFVVTSSTHGFLITRVSLPPKAWKSLSCDKWLNTSASLFLFAALLVFNSSGLLQYSSLMPCSFPYGSFPNSFGVRCPLPSS